MAGSEVYVAAGIIISSADDVLITERLPGSGHGAGYWEFPGGKLEPGESAADALARELVEELGVRIERSFPFMALSHQYPKRLVNLDFRLVFDWQGDALALEGQGMQWVRRAVIDQHELLPADAPVIERLQSYTISELRNFSKC